MYVYFGMFIDFCNEGIYKYMNIIHAMCYVIYIRAVCEAFTKLLGGSARRSNI